MGLAFAIPIDVAMNAVSQIREKGKVTRGQIGVQIQEVTKEIAEAFGLAKPSGALVNSVEKGGPAEKAGVETDDIIVKADGREIHTSSELPRIITAIKPGAKVTLTVWRKGAQTRHRGRPSRKSRTRHRDAAASQQPGRRRRGSRTGWASARRPHRRAEEGARNQERRRIEDITGSVRGNVQPGDVILAIVNRGQTTEAKSAEQVIALLSKLERALRSPCA